VTLAGKINTQISDNELNEDTYWRIIEGSRRHMGICTTDERYKPNNMVRPVIKAFANLIYLADYCASRKVDTIYSFLGEKE